jgi:hypothetical protein
VESPLRRKAHGGFGERPGETGRQQCPHRAPGRLSLLAFLDRPEVANGEALAGLLRPGNAGSNTAEDHAKLLGMALESLPLHAKAPARRPRFTPGAGPLRLRRSHSPVRRRLPLRFT